MNESVALPDDPVLPAAGTAAPPPEAEAEESKRRSSRDATLVGVGWLGTGLSLSIAALPFRFLLKDTLGLSPEQLAGFMAIANIPIYVKPFAGILSDAVPLFGTRRQSYLVTSLFLGGFSWLLLSLVPRTFQSLLWTYLFLNLFLVMISTVLGGLMVEVGKRDRTTGKLSAQRLGISRLVELVAGPLGGYLSTVPFIFTAAISAGLNFLLLPVFALFLKEPRSTSSGGEVLIEVKRQSVALFRSRTLWSAAALVVLVIAAPGFGTPLLYHQTDTLGFSKQFIGWLGVVTGLCSVGGALIYNHFCRRWNLRMLLAASIIFHAVMTLWYLAYRSELSAIIITGIEAATMVLALLPLYDLAARATPHGSEALGYSLMMSVWNFTHAMSDLAGSWLYSHLGLTFQHLVWVNAGTTALVLVAVPFLPAALMNRRDGDPEALGSH